MIITYHKFPSYPGSAHDHCASLNGKNNGLNNDIMVLETCILLTLMRKAGLYVLINENVAQS